MQNFDMIKNIFQKTNSWTNLIQVPFKTFQNKLNIFQDIFFNNSIIFWCFNNFSFPKLLIKFLKIIFHKNQQIFHSHINFIFNDRTIKFIFGNFLKHQKGEKVKFYRFWEVVRMEGANFLSLLVNFFRAIPIMIFFQINFAWRCHITKSNIFSNLRLIELRLNDGMSEAWWKVKKAVAWLEKSFHFFLRNISIFTFNVNFFLEFL
jgi:hypothetical protein